MCKIISENQLQKWEQLANEVIGKPWYMCGTTISAVREAVPALIARVRELEAELTVIEDNNVKRLECIDEKGRLKNRIRQLEKEADYLARSVMALTAAYQHPCPHDDCKHKDGSQHDADMDDICRACWRDVARKEVSND